MNALSVRMEKSGRILIPAAIRKKLHLKPGSELLLTLNESGLQVGTRDQALARVRRRLRKYIEGDRLLSEELLRERRQEAARENAK